MLITIIAAISKNHVLGRNNQLPWRLPADTKHYKYSIKGRTIVMGRKTADSPDMFFSDHRNVLVTRQKNYTRKGFEVYDSLQSALATCQHEKEVMITGGAEIYRQALPMADRLLLTHIDAEVEGDAFFPQFNINNEWQATSIQQQPPDAQHPYGFEIRAWQRSDL